MIQDMNSTRYKNVMKSISPFLMVLPSISVFLLCYLVPIGYMLYLSVFDWDFISPTKTFVGFGNFVKLITRGEFLQVLKNTFVFTAGSVIFAICFALLLAVWLNKNKRIFKFVQAVIFTPHIISLVSVSFVWMWLMEPNYGLLNYGLSLLGLPTSQWLQHNDSAMASLIIVSVWKLVGYDTLILLAALQSIPTTIFEAANLDRASKPTVFFKIIIPMISPSLFFLLVMNTLAMSQNFDTVSIMTQGGPLNSTNTLVYFIYNNSFQYYKMGYASAAGTVLLLIISLLTILYFKFLGKKVYYR